MREVLESAQAPIARSVELRKDRRELLPFAVLQVADAAMGHVRRRRARPRTKIAPLHEQARVHLRLRLKVAQHDALAAELHQAVALEAPEQASHDFARGPELVRQRLVRLRGSRNVDDVGTDLANMLREGCARAARDNGRGGARFSAGHGLEGLRDRIANMRACGQAQCEG